MENINLKLLMIGNSGVGKTSLVQRLCVNSFSESNDPTLGVEFMVYPMKINDTMVQLQIWETAGQEKYQALGRTYCLGAVGIMLVFAFNDHDSLDKMEDWINNARSLCNPHACMLLVGNKIDLTESREISRTEVEQFAQAHQLEFIETSAKTSINVAEAFYKTARNILLAVAAKEIKLPMQIHDQPAIDKTKTKKRCCN